MADTVEQIVRRLRGLCPLAPALTCLEWVQEAYNQISDNRRWSHLRGEGQITIQDSREGTCTVVQGSATVIGVGLVFVAGDAGRQFRIGSMLPATILSVNTGANTCLLDQPYGSASATATTGQILDAYITMPEDFGSFIAVIDPPNNRRLNIYVTDDEVNFFNPQRAATGSPRAIASRRLSTYPATEDQIQYELLPYQLSTYVYPYFYSKRPAALALTDTLKGVFRHRPDILLKGAILECCKWPGAGVTPDKINPYTRLSDGMKLAMASEYQFMLAQLESKDEEIYLTWLETVNLNEYPFYNQAFTGGDYRNTDAG